MITALIIIGIAFGWLAKETNFLRVHLQTGKDKPVNIPIVQPIITPIDKPVDKTAPYWWQSPKNKEKHLIICNGCNSWRNCRERKGERWTGWKLPARTIKAFGSTMNLAEGCNIARADLLKQVANINNRKPATRLDLPDIPIFITRERIGSYNEWTRWNSDTNELERLPKYKKGYSHRIVEDYTTLYKDCLASKAWIKKHEHFEYPEPTIELVIDGELKASINGNYKKGLISETLKPYTKTVRAGKKSLTILKEGHIENMGGGCYIAINGELKDGVYQYYK